MITKSRVKPANNKGVQPFTMRETITLPLVTEDPKYAGEKKTFLQGGKGAGQLVHAQVAAKTSKGIYQPLVNGIGVGIICEGGYYLVPVDKLTWDSDTWNNPPIDTHINADGDAVVSEVIEEAGQAQEHINEAIKSDKKILGFTYKQLFVIAAVGLIINRLIK